MAAHSKGRIVFTHYLNWERAVREQNFIPVDFNEHFPENCLKLLEAGYYIRSGGQIMDLPKSKDPIIVCNAIFERFNADNRPDGKWRRSFSVADLVQIDKSYFVCRSVGWQELIDPKSSAERVIKSDEV